MRIKQCISLVLASSFVLPAIPVQAGEQTLELLSNGRYQSHRLPDDAQEVQMVRPLAGSCVLDRSWGYDLGRRELWVRDGCGARFRVMTQDGGQSASEEKDHTGAWIAGAAMVAIAGAAILASRSDDDRGSRDRNDYPPYDDGRNPGYPQPGYPQPGYPQPGYPGYPQPGNSSWGGQQIRGQNGLCLDVSGGVRPGNELIVYRCAGSENQRFTYTRDGELRVGNLCLDVAGGNTRSGARVIAWECRNQPNQKWEWSRGQIRSRFAGGQCLDIEGGNARPGQPVIMWPCAGTSNQRWD